MTRQRIIIGETSVPRLPRHVKFRFDEARGQWVVLAPERVLLPDETATEILQLCDGVASVAGIADTLAGKYAAPREIVAQDVIQMLQDLADKAVVEV